MSQINLFNNESLNVTIKTITDNNNVLWFRAKDIALYLGYLDTINAIKQHVKDKYKTKLCNIEASNRGVSNTPLTYRGGDSPPLPAHAKNTTYITDCGLYQLIFKSKIPTSELFTEWIVEEVIPLY